MTKRKLLQVALPIVTVAALLSACGADSGDSAGSGPAKIRVGASAGRNAGGGAEVAAASDAKMAMMPLQKLVFELGEGVEAPGGSRRAWYFPANPGEVSQATKDRLASVFGLTGTWKTYPKDQGGASYLGDSGKGEASISVMTDAMQSWWYGAAWNTTPMVGCAEPAVSEPVMVEDLGGSGSSDGSAPSVDGSETTPTVIAEPDTKEAELRPCETPAPPKNVPNKDEAIAKAKELLTQLGLNLDSYEFEAYADDWSASVSAWLLIEGQRSGAAHYVSFGGEGAITGAGGFLAEMVEGDEYELVDLETAVKRLNDTGGYWWGGYYPMMRAADSAVARTAEISAAGGGAVGITGESTDPGLAPEPVPGSDGGASVETLPIDSVPVVVVDTTPVTEPPLEEVKVTLTKVTVGYQQLWDADGNVWFLPSYFFTASDGGQYNVFAIADEYLDFTSVNEVPMPAVEPAIEPAVVDEPTATVVVPEAIEDAEPVEASGGGMN